MAAASQLEELPIELLDAVTEGISLRDALNLRLVSRLLADKVTQTTFRVHSVTRTVRLTRSSLERFSSMTVRPWPSSILKKLILVGFVGCKTDEDIEPDDSEDEDFEDVSSVDMEDSESEYAESELELEDDELKNLEHETSEFETSKPAAVETDTECQNIIRAKMTAKDLGKQDEAPAEDLQQDISEEESAQERIELLTVACKNLRRHLARGRLPALVLSVEDTDEGIYSVSADAIWSCAAATLRAVEQAFKRSRLQTARLDVYGTTLRCALNIAELSVLQNLLDSKATKSLSLTFSANRGTSGGSMLPKPHIADMLASLEQLENLELRYVNLSWDPASDMAECAARAFFTGIVELPALLPALKTVSLKGVSTISARLLSFLQAHPDLQCLSLYRIRLTVGRFAPIFKHLDLKMSKTSLDLDELLEHRLVLFLGLKGHPRHRGRLGGSRFLKRSPSDEWLPIRYRVAAGRDKDSPENRRRASMAKLLCGPVH